MNRRVALKGLGLGSVPDATDVRCPALGKIGSLLPSRGREDLVIEGLRVLGYIEGTMR